MIDNSLQYAKYLYGAYVHDAPGNGQMSLTGTGGVAASHGRWHCKIPSLRTTTMLYKEAKYPHQVIVIQIILMFYCNPERRIHPLIACAASFFKQNFIDM